MTMHKTDVLLIGGGIMSKTLAMLVTQLDPSRHVTLVEQAAKLGTESTHAWNNAGTGHAGYCELNYTPQQSNGEIEIERALGINARFEESLQFWSGLVHKGALSEPTDFINPVPHMSWVQGKENVNYLKSRQKALVMHPLFEEMEYADDPASLNEWLPLMMAGRDMEQPMAATRVAYGTDINFGELTRAMGEHLSHEDSVDYWLSTWVSDLKKVGDRWHVTTKHALAGTRTIEARFVFVGAGGCALPLLQKAGVEEVRGYGGFPVSGIWLASENMKAAATHNAKVYGMPPVGAPPMSVPHLDTRVIDGRPALLFGPFAGFTTRFLKKSSLFDLINSIRSHNLKPMLEVAREHWALTRYLIKEAMSSGDQRVEQLRDFLPSVQPGEWHLRRAGQRVQIIKLDKKGRGKLQFGTEVIKTADRSLAGLLGASPGASVSVSAMLEVIENCLPDLVEGEARQRLETLIPSYGHSLDDDLDLVHSVRRYTLETLALDDRKLAEVPEQEELLQTGT
ncbi:malate:quinone oxidoreductase [Solemya velum gill symbiont]|uniref:malate dehydrogenase (quinone) n=1 Tax=Solemya velum gill symbiont TaxID=2340 RepID=UPI0009988B81|nr:malate dehydrogenase (quinone) [Solemya velum gill symbiont]OOZ17053.1 malate:quinone oxidoreductase [Solemya velum gill symbiont]OOZ26487.1 malate:quinone oxidoreductase [Solemya velum gill symbiont]